jgi:DNA polymerase-1
MRGELYLIDAYSIIYRGYFAFLNRPLLNPQGRNTSSIFVFFRTILDLTAKREPGYIAVVMDSRVPTFRHKKYPLYKANRDKAPEDLHSQVPVIEEILEAIGIASIRVDGFEADDVIATLSERCRSSGRPCWIISGDKDILQLVGGNVRLLAQEKGVSDFKEYSRESILESRGIYPERIVDYLALTGDASDNVPGVKGIGDKTALKLLSEYKDLDDIYARIGDVTPESLRLKLTEGREAAYQSRDLVTLVRDVPGVPEMERFRFGGLKAEALPLFEREGMKSVAKELMLRAGGASSPVPKETAEPRGAPAPHVLAGTAPGTHAVVAELGELDRIVKEARAAGTYAFDVETDSTDEMRAVPIGFSLCYAEGKAYYVPLRAADMKCLPEAAVKQRIGSLISDPAVKLVGQNAKYDFKVLTRWGVRPANVHFDTMVAAWVLDSEQNTYGLDGLAERYLSYRTIPYGELVPKGATLADLPVQKVADYSGEDADLTLRMFRCLREELDKANLLSVLMDIEVPLIPVLADMELAGIRVLSNKLQAYGKEMEKDLSALEASVYELCGRTFNINSTKQLQEILFNWRKLVPVKKTKTGYSTDMDVLEILAAQDPVPEKILAHRKLSKLKSTYVDALPLLVNADTGRLHTHYIQTGTATGRLSSKDPNLQNIPIREEEGRRIRAAFVPAGGMRFISADYSQIELAILAHFSQDPILLSSFREGKDIHRQTAALIFGTDEAAVSPEQRRVGKTINFGVVYGMSAYGLSQSLKIRKSDADRFITTYFQRFKRVDEFLKETVRSAEQTGFVHTLLGRRRRINGIMSRNRTEKNAAERVAVNSPIQGTAADIVKLAMVKLHAGLLRERLKTRILLQVHDEMVLESPEEEVPRAEKLVASVMEGVVERGIPLNVKLETGDSWGDFH